MAQQRATEVLHAAVRGDQHQRFATRGQVRRQACGEAFGDVDAAPGVIVGVARRAAQERWIEHDAVEPASRDRCEQVALQHRHALLQALQQRVDARATHGGGIDVHGRHFTRRARGRQRARAGTGAEFQHAAPAHPVAEQVGGEARVADIVREYGPFTGVEKVAGVTHDGTSYLWSDARTGVQAPARTRRCTGGHGQGVFFSETSSGGLPVALSSSVVSTNGARAAWGFPRGARGLVSRT